MGRKPSNPGAIPRFRVRKQDSGRTFYYYDHGGKPGRETPLGSDYRGIAAKRRAETRLLSRAAGLDRYAASLEPAEEEKLPF